ncbi:MAG: sulfatase-like hydrolase/transferase [Phycisphaeraceae bacterium]|nr:MAG: sulfatase-like hydrolase/transferase [Phycisphaeraceae bacterium]
MHSFRHRLLVLIPLVLASITPSSHANAAPAHGEQAAPIERPNIILVLADDLSRRQSTFLPEGEGRALMPTLDRLAHEGTVLGNLRSPSPICTPSRFALLSGRYACRSRHPWFTGEMERDGQSVVQFNTFLVEGDRTLPMMLRDAGYATGAVGKDHVIAVPGYEKLAYESDPTDPTVHAKMLANAEALEKAFHNAGFDYAKSLYFGNPDADGIKALAVHNQEWITAAGLDFIEQNAGHPFFLYIATTLTHGPYAPERSWKADPRITPVGLLDEVPRVQAPRDTIEPRLRAAGIHTPNAGAVLWLDDAMTAIVDKLRGLGIGSRTLIIFLGDHGTEAKGTCYEAGLLTPGFVWREGGFDARSPVHDDIQLMDLTATILDFAGADTGADLDGRSIRPLLDERGRWEARPIYSEVGYSRAVIAGGFKYLALRYPQWALDMSLDERAAILQKTNDRLRERGIEPLTEDPNAPFSHLFLIPGGHDADRAAIGHYPAYYEPDQLYDLTADPDEQHNLANDPAYADRLEAMKRLLAGYVHDLPGGFGEFEAMQP